MYEETKLLKAAFLNKENNQELLARLDRLLAEGSISVEKYNLLKSGYQQKMTAAVSEISSIKSGLKLRLQEIKNELASYGADLENLRVRHDVGEVTLGAYQRAERKLLKKMSGIKKDMPAIQSLVDAKSSDQLVQPKFVFPRWALITAPSVVVICIGLFTAWWMLGQPWPLTAPVTTPPEPADVVVTQPEWPSIIASVEPAVVKIQTEDQTACGVIIDTGGYIITHSSVIIPDKSITITLQHERQYSGEIAGQDEKLNLTIVKVTSDNTTLPVAVLGDSEGLKPRDKVAVIGYAPDKLDLNEDVIGTVVTIVDETKSIYTDIPFTDKILGAALINDKGEVIGIVAGRISTNEVKDSAFAIAINEARPLIEQATGKQ